MAADAVLEIQVKTVAELKALKDATSELTKIQKQADNTNKSINKSLGGIVSGFKGLTASLGPLFVAFQAIKGTVNLFGDSIAEASEAQKALNSLTLTLESTGEATASVIKDFQSFASEMQQTTRFGDDLIIQQITLAKNFGLTSDKAKELVRAASNLSAATGKDLESSVQALLKSLTGQLPRDLKTLGVEFGNLTEAQLKAGAAQDIISKKFAGRASADILTYEGRVAQLSNSYSDLKEAIGGVIVQSGAVSTFIGQITTLIRVVGGLEGEEEKLKRLREELVEMKKANDSLGQFVRSRQIANLEILINGKKFAEGQQELDELILQTKGIGKDGSKQKPIPITFEPDQESVSKVVKDLEKIGLSAAEISKQEKENRLKDLKAAFGGEEKINLLSVENRKLYTDNKLKIEKQFSADVGKLRNEQEKKEAESLKRRQDIFKNAQENIFKGFSEAINTGNKDALAGAIAGGARSITQGAGGARNLGGAAASFGVGAALPGIGQVIGPAVGELVTELAKGKEAARAFVTEFLQAIPEMVIGLIEGIVEAAATFAEQVPLIVERFVEGIPRIITALVEQMPRVGVELATQMPIVATTFATSLIEQAPAIAQAIVKSIGNAPGNAAKGFGKVFKFAEGGQAVRSVPAGNGNGSTERFPAVLGSGELVVDRSTAYKLKSFLDQQAQSNLAQGDDTSSNKVKDLMRALQSPISVSIDGREVARAVRRQVNAGFAL